MACTRRGCLCEGPSIKALSVAKEQDGGQQLISLSDVVVIAGRVDALNDFTGEGHLCPCVLLALDFVQPAIFFVEFALCHFTGRTPGDLPRLGGRGVDRVATENK